MDSMQFAMFIPTRLLFGAGQLNNLKNCAMPGKKAMLVISNGKSTKANGYLGRTEEQLREAGVESVVFDKIEANPLKSTVMAGGDFARAQGCDFIVALGGGSCMDAAKAIAVVATNDGDLWDYVALGTGKGKPIANKPLPIIAITTTAGTGSEIDNGGVITNSETNEKTAIGSEQLFPVISIVDPELMTTVPPHFTAFQGFDAFLQAVEGYISKGANPMGDMLALTAIENIGKYLPIAVQDGKDMEARAKVAFANTLSGMVMDVGPLTSEHALEHALSAFHQNLPHGAGLIMISRAFFTHFIEKSVSPDRFVRMAKAMGMDGAKEAKDFITALVALQERCGVSNLKMSDYGIVPDEFSKMAQNARDSMRPLFDFDPIPLSHEDCVKIYELSYK
jgi:Alcohol dehydrogenase, class IV